MNKIEYSVLYGMLLIQLTIIIASLIRFPENKAFQIFAILIGLASGAALLAGLSRIYAG